MHLVGLFAGIFFQQGDHWKLFNVLKQDYPTKQEYMELDTIILSGSSLSVNDETPEVIKFIETLKEGINLNPKMKILGVCFGHQVLAKMFSGTVIQKHLLAGV
jgi:GMP synthase-like glutamine amidotransferase